MIDTVTTSNLCLKKENNENNMAAQVFWAVFYSSRQPSQIGPKADFDGASIPSPIIFHGVIYGWPLSTFILSWHIDFRRSTFFNKETGKSVVMRKRHTID